MRSETEKDEYAYWLNRLYLAWLLKIINTNSKPLLKKILMEVFLWKKE